MTDINFDELLSNATEVKFEIPEGMDIDYEDFLISFAATLFDYREKNNLTKTQLANLLNISEDMLSNYESALIDLKVKDLFVISKKLNLKLNLKIGEEV